MDVNPKKKEEEKDKEKGKENGKENGQNIINTDNIINQLENLNLKTDKEAEKINTIKFEDKNQANNGQELNAITGSTNSQSDYQQNEKLRLFYSHQGDQNNYNQINNEIKSAQIQVPNNLGQFNYKDITNIPINTFNQNALSKASLFAALRNQQTTIIYQRLIMGSKGETIQYIINQLKGSFRIIIKNKNGNYLCSDLIKVCDQKQRIEILNELSPYLSEDCINNYATHSIQALIERSSEESEYNLILDSFRDLNKFLYAALSPNGAFTMQKIIERIPEKYRTQFNILFISFIGFISKKKFGIVVVKKFIEYTKNDEVTLQIFNFVKNNFEEISTDQYANYLIQFLLEKWKDTNEGNQIKELVKINFIPMSEKKYSSFIIESYIKMLRPEEKMELIKSINIEEANNSTNPHFIKIMKALGIYNNPVNNNIQIPLNFNNAFEPNLNFNQNMASRFNFANNNYFANNNNTFNYMNNNNNYKYKKNKKNH